MTSSAIPMDAPPAPEAMPPNQDEKNSNTNPPASPTKSSSSSSMAFSMDLNEAKSFLYQQSNDAKEGFKSSWKGLKYFIQHQRTEKDEPYRLVIDLRQILLLWIGIFALTHLVHTTQPQPLSTSSQQEPQYPIDLNVLSTPPPPLPQCTRPIPPPPSFASHTTYRDARASASAAPQCLEFGTTFDEIVDRVNQAFILAPPKGSGSSLTTFSRVCADGHKFPAFNEANMIDEIFMHPTFPSVIVQHIFQPGMITHMMNTLPQDALIILIYREESKRKASGVKHIAETRLCGNQVRTPSGFGDLEKAVGLKYEGEQCVIENELQFIERVVERRFDEVAGEMNHIMSCPFHEALKNHFPNVVMVNYKQIDDVQVALSKKFCPHKYAAGKIPVEEQNVSGQKTTHPQIRLRETGERVSIVDWVEDKRPFMDFALHWDEEQDDFTSCQSDTRLYENTMMTCKDKAVRLSGL